MAGPLSSSTLKVRLLNVLSFCNPSLRFRKTKSFFQLTSVSCLLDSPHAFSTMVNMTLLSLKLALLRGGPVVMAVCKRMTTY